MATIELDITKFRESFPAYADDTAYPDALIQMRWDEATCYVSNQNYGRLHGACRERAIMYMTAHLIYLEDAMNSGAPAGQVQSASEDGVSVSLTPPPNRNEFQWWLNQSQYGQKLVVLLSTSLVGGLYIGGSTERRGFRKHGGGF